MSRILGYLSQGFDGQSAQVQFSRLKAAGAAKVFREQSTAGKRDRPQLDELMKAVGAGDTLLVTSLFHLAHNTQHLLEIVEALNATGVSLKVIDCGIDTSSPHGEVIVLLLGAIADFERQKVRERQAAGIARAKREGRYKGRKPTARAKTDEVLALNAQGLTRQKIADQLGIGVASVYRILKNHTTPQMTGRKARQKPAGKPKRGIRKPPREPAEQLSLF